MREIMEYTDKVTILRKGENVGSFVTNTATEEELIHSMVGEKKIHAIEKETKVTDTVLLDVASVTVHDDRMNQAVKKVSFQVLKHFWVVSCVSVSPSSLSEDA